MVMPILNTIPIVRIVPSVPEATPKYLFSTEPITALVLGEEKSAKPNPRRIKVEMMNPKEDISDKNIKRKSPPAVNAIPMEATIRGSILTESLPVKGEKKACTMGWDNKINPAFSAVSPLIYCK